MKVKPLLALPKEFEVRSIDATEERVTITAASIQSSASCPLCGTPTSRVHSHYLRHVADLPSGGRQVCLALHVRRFFSDVPACPRKIFAERLTPFVESRARVTARLYRIVQVIGLATGGRLGVRVTDRLGIVTSWMTIIRRIMALPTVPVEQVSQLGIDDFAFRRRRNFGTILVERPRHQVIDLLPDRTAETAAAWMAEHPEIDLLSRDRGGDYAAAARKSAPQARQIADRFHIYKILTEAVELALARCRAEIRANSEIASQGEIPPEVREALGERVKGVSIETWKPAPDACDERARLTRRAERYDRYQQVITLHAQGFEQAEMAHRTGVSTRTIRRWLKAESFPERKQRRKQPSSFDPYAAYVPKRWEEGCRNGLHLWQEIKNLGYTGSAVVVNRFLIPRRVRQQMIRNAQAPQAPLQDFSAKEAVWLVVRDPASLDEQEQATLASLCQASATAKTVYHLVQEFRHMLHLSFGAKLDDWLAQVRERGISELQRFVVGVERDKAAVVAGLTLPQNNGLVEGKVNKLKLIKRMGYGRAGFPLLRQRVLHAL
jgi:transposase